jgi:hypothetical protein
MKRGAPGIIRHDEFTAEPWSLAHHGGHMALYTVHVSDPSTSTSRGDSLNAVRAYYKVRQLRDQGFKCITLINVDTGEEITDVDSLVRDSPRA